MDANRHTAAGTTHATRGRVFISHSVEDRRVANLLRHLLSDAGFEVFDPSANITSGESLMAALSQAVASADFCVFLLGKEDSSWLQSEQALAVSRVLSGGSVRLLPVLYGPDAKLPFLLRNFLALRVADASEAPKIVAALLELIESPSQPVDLNYLADSARLRAVANRLEQEELFDAKVSRRSELVRISMRTLVLLALLLMFATVALLALRRGESTTLLVVVAGSTSTFAAILSSFWFSITHRYLDRSTKRIAQLEAELSDKDRE